MTTNVKWKLSRYVTIGDFMPQWIQIIWYDKAMTSNFFWSVFRIPILWDVLWYADGTGWHNREDKDTHKAEEKHF